jgi:GNAT superfamily N-acetyltransferase
MKPEPAVEYHAAADLPGLRPDLLRVYVEVYAQRLGDPFFSPERYWERVTGYATRDGFSLVTGRLDGDLIGYAMGFTLPADTGWWRGFRGDVPAGTLAEDGRRTLALTYLMIRPAWQGRGYAHALHDALLRPRSEKRAALLVVGDNERARTAYLAWGWRKLGELQPFPDAPVYDAMVLDLAGGSVSGVGFG